mgnify:CR=1 FL=1
MAITSESQIIDITAINNGCAIIEEAAEDYITCAKHIKDAAGSCSGEALAVEGKTMQPSLEELAVSVEQIQQNIRTFTGEIRSVAMQIQQHQLNELAEYRKQQASNQQGQ